MSSKVVSCVICMALYLTACPAPGQALAGEPTVMRLTITDQDVSMDFKMLPDGDRHVLALAHRKGEAAFPDGTRATYEAHSLIDAWVGQKGVRYGYSMLLFDDGSRIFCSWKADSKRNRENLPSLVGEGSITKGAGRFQGIVGKLQFTSVQQKATNQDSRRTRITDMTLTYTTQ